MAHQARDQSSISALDSIGELVAMGHLCNDWSFEAPMRSCECHPDSPMLCCNAAAGPGPNCSRVFPSRGPVRVDAVSSVSSTSVRLSS